MQIDLRRRLTVKVRRQGLACSISEGLGILSVLPSLVLLVGCCQAFNTETKTVDTSARAWLRSWTGPYDWTQTTNWSYVVPPQLPSAETKLELADSVQLTTERALELVGTLPSSASGKTPYLLRAVGDAGGKWPLEVYVRRETEIWVGGGAVSDCAPPLRRRAVVVWLEKPPSRVYVTFVVGR